ncbi:MAG: S41 family peptidase [Dehalococcoidia bacterium]|nr:S41 family peptidase [Dehalococcoidia bacterium]
MFAVLVLGACASESASTVETETVAVEEASETQTVVPYDPMALPTALPAVPIDIPDPVPEDLATAWEVWNLISQQHVDRDGFESEEFDEGAIRGLLAALGDAHTNYVPPEAFQIDNEDLYGSFEGIGANVQMNADGKLFIVAPLDGSPAEAAGLRSGDLILAVNGESIEGLSLLEAVNKIRGPRGTDVTLLVRHLGQIEEVELVVRRNRIELDSVLVRNRPEDRFAHIRLTTFYSDTPEDLAEAIEEQQANGVEGLILDVRDNPGGLLSSVVEVVSMFIDDDGLILYELDGAGRRTDHRARNSGQFADIPLVILANRGSASASEIVVGALQDHDRAQIVGDKTFGKGSVNRLYRLGNGGGLYLTFAKWYTPEGRLIEGNGIEPDHEVTSRDRQRAETIQLEKAVEVMEEIVGGTTSGGA